MIPTIDFRSLFSRDADVAADAPGRVNLIGEHTDYNAGFVLPTAIPQRTNVELARRRDDLVRVASGGMDGGAVSEFGLGREARTGGWLDYVQGCTSELTNDGFAIGGFDALVNSRVPVGAGVASSAALEVSLLRALRAAFGLDLDDVALAMIGHRCENRFVGAHTGVLDQMAASLCETRTALFLDTRTLEWRRVQFPESAEIVVIDSGVAHSHAGGAYNTRHEECERAARLLGVVALRDVGEGNLKEIAKLPEPLDRRARHVVTENERVLATVDALQAGNAARVGELFDASHESLRRDYEVSIDEIDALIDIARGDEDIHGARITGGGFGGSIVAIAKRGCGAVASGRIARAYANRTGKRPAVLVPDVER